MGDWASRVVSISTSRQPLRGTEVPEASNNSHYHRPICAMVTTPYMKPSGPSGRTLYHLYIYIFIYSFVYIFPLSGLLMTAHMPDTGAVAYTSNSISTCW